jgi:hypothetical protein
VPQGSQGPPDEAYGAPTHTALAVTIYYHRETPAALALDSRKFPNAARHKRVVVRRVAVTVRTHRYSFRVRAFTSPPSRMALNRLLFRNDGALTGKYFASSSSPASDSSFYVPLLCYVLDNMERPTL